VGRWREWQAPLFVSLFFAVKDLSDKFPAFAEVPWLWCPSLAAPDPWLLLPSAAGASLLAVLEVGLETRKASTDPTSLRLQRGIQRICCFSMVPLLVGLKYPAAVFLYWITNNLVSGVQVPPDSEHRRGRLSLLDEP
jgi:YidC/Oxa1 family membrane protein insertase